MRKSKKELIWYYREGWRAGYVVRRGYKWVKIRVIYPEHAKPRKRGVYARIKVEDTKEVQ